MAKNIHIHFHDEANPHGELKPGLREKIGRPGSEERRDDPASVFLEPGSKKYPVKLKEDGEWKYNKNLLLAAARRARMEGDESLAQRADAIREREFGGGKES